MKKIYDYEFRPMESKAFVEMYFLVLKGIIYISSERESMNLSTDLVDVLTAYTLEEDSCVHNWIITEKRFDEEEGEGVYAEWFNDMLERSEYVYKIKFQQYWTFWDGGDIYIVDDTTKSRWFYYCD